MLCWLQWPVCSPVPFGVGALDNIMSPIKKFDGKGLCGPPSPLNLETGWSREVAAGGLLKSG